MIYTVHAGHAAPGAKYCGAVGHVDESRVARYIKDKVIQYLKQDGQTVYDCTVDKGVSQSNIITQIKKKINSYKGASANISIHLNACSKEGTDGKTKGVECCVYSYPSDSAALGTAICSRIAALGFTNRGVKVRTNLGVLKGITNGGRNVLVECFFCDDLDDVQRYQAVTADAVGKAIAEAVLGKTITAEEAEYVTVRGVQLMCTEADKAISGEYRTIRDCVLAETPGCGAVVRLGVNAIVYYEGWHYGEYAFVGYNKTDKGYAYVGFIHGSLLKKV